MTAGLASCRPRRSAVSWRISRTGPGVSSTASVAASMNGPNGMCVLRVRSPGRDQHQAHDCGQHEAAEQAGQRGAGAEPAQVQAEDAGQLHVAQADAGRADQPQDAVEQRARGQAGQRVEVVLAACGDGQRGAAEQGQRDGVRGQRQAVRQPVGQRVDPRQRHADQRQVAVRGQQRGPAEPQHAGGQERGRQERQAQRQPPRDRPPGERQRPPGQRQAGGWRAGFLVFVPGVHFPGYISTDPRRLPGCSALLPV